MTSKRHFLILCALAVTAWSATRVARADSAAKPNIVFILIDDLGWSDIACYGNPIHRTPNIDRLASQGMRFTDAYAACPVCSPTRASIHAGQYPAHVGVIDFITGHWRPFEKFTVPINRTQYLPASIPTLADMLKTAGYTNAHFGKWHLGGGKYGPQHRGFAVTTPPKKATPKKPRPASAAEWLQTIDVTDDNPKDVDRLTQLALDFITDHQDGPFFLYLSHHTVHIPLAAKPKTVEKYRAKGGRAEYDIHPAYSAMVEEMDTSVGQVMQKLDELKLSEDTLVVFFSDNGGLIQDYHKLGPICTSNKPLRGQKGTLYEGGIREPLIVRWPGKIRANATCATPVSSVDFYPTFLDLLDIERPTQHVLDGLSLLPLLLGQEAHDLPDRVLFWHYPVYHHASPAGAIRQGDWKLIETLGEAALELYNLKEDIEETNNLAQARPEQTHALHEKLKAWRKSVNARLPVPNPDFDPQRRYEWGTHPSRRQ